MKDKLRGNDSGKNAEVEIVTKYKYVANVNETIPPRLMHICGKK